MAAKTRDVFCDPMKGRDDIHQAVIARRVAGRLLRQQPMGQKTKNAGSIVKCDEHDILASESFAIVQRSRAGTVDEAAAINKDHYWQFVLCQICGRPDV